MLALICAQIDNVFFLWHIGSLCHSKINHQLHRDDLLVLGRTIKQKYPNIRIIGCSVVSEREVTEWFEKYGNGFIHKPSLSFDIVEKVKQAAKKSKAARTPNCFIVHGHNNEALYELKSYLQNVLGFDEPVVLREQPSRGRTIIEKFEEETNAIDIVFVLLTPDDKTLSGKASNEVKRRARQNVIFETGYFFAKLQRKKGKVILLHKGEVELPSDISGIIYIDISAGVEQAGELIRKELKEWL